MVFYTVVLYKGVWLRYEVKTPCMTGIITPPKYTDTSKSAIAPFIKNSACAM